MPSLLVLLLAVAATLTFSFFGFLVSRLFAPVPLDMGWLLMAAPDGVMPDGSIFVIDAQRRAGLPDGVFASGRCGLWAAGLRISGREGACMGRVGFGGVFGKGYDWERRGARS
ncbi:hypothetical protein OAN307_c11680 [Octadecabacter antarcticus 307]|uniref:Uncharacterized protein n=1 Tax=Octadecabacter antarcticus 307 TaxID=391626 RepID=M9RAS5_9RHOB|nr:hypothetical protein OAN307_c11680 [Octadecabacter antarcticus 307]